MWDARRRPEQGGSHAGVSHQGEFHDRARFPHGYRLRRDGDVTEVERFV